MPFLLFLGAYLLTVAFYSLERVQFLLWNWSYYKNQPVADILLAFGKALRFDLSAVSMLSAMPFLVFWLAQMLFKGRSLSLKGQRWLMVLFVLFHLPTMVFNLGDAEFINFLGRRYTFDALFLFNEVPGKFWQIIASYAFLTSINVAIMATYAVLVIVWLPKKLPALAKFSWKKSLAAGLALFVALGVASRGGLQSKPINFSHAQTFLSPMMNSLVLNSSFTLLQTIKRKALPRESFFQNEEMLELLQRGIAKESLLDRSRPAVKPNVVLVLLESFSLEFVGFANNGQGYTPFLDEISAQSIFFRNAFANARRSIEGVGAVMGGVPALMDEPFISSQYLTNYFLGVGTWLQKAGYETAFFHGAQNGSMYFDQFMKSAGVQKHFGKNEYPNPADDDGTWGIWDEPFLQWTNEQIKTFKQPFFATIFTLSSHNPFKLPPGYEGRYPKGTQEIHPTIGYTDEALRKFFEAARKEPWFENTVFIITADHTFKGDSPEYQNELGNYRVPLLIYSPKIKLPKPDEGQIVQHIDILPTILDLVGIPEKEKNYLGTSVFVPGDRFSVNFTDGRYMLIARDYFLSYNRGGEFRMFSMQDAAQTQTLTEPAERKKLLEDRLKAGIQYFSQGMWDNKLYYPSGR